MIKKQTLDDVWLSQDNTDITLSYSRVSDFDRNGPKALLHKVQDETQGLKMGSLIDDLKFNKDKFNELYHVSNFNEPTASLNILCKIILKNFIKVPSLAVVTNLVEINELWAGTKNPKLKLEKYNTEEFWGYINDKFKGLNKTVITPEELHKGNEVVEVLNTHKFTKDLFSDELEHFYQYKFKIKIKQFYFRGILDIISVDHKNKVVYFKDLKTGGGPSSEFLTSFIKWRYYLQGAVYTLAFDEICKTLNLKDYTLAPFEFVYIGLKELLPVSYIMTPKWLNASINGFKTSNGYHYKGLYELIDEIYFHWKNQVYDLPMNIYKNNGKVNLEDNFVRDE